MRAAYDRAAALAEPRASSAMALPAPLVSARFEDGGGEDAARLDVAGVPLERCCCLALPVGVGVPARRLGLGVLDVRLLLGVHAEGWRVCKCLV